uniref:Uncharacterized protein n=1 Tax=Gopherus agassizii TaxID=38772 RepID=A0A452GP19_9SAUR
MNAVSALLLIRGITQERNPMNAVSAGKPSLGAHTLLDIRGATQERNPINAVSVEKPLLRAHTLLYIRGATLERNLMNAVSVEKPLQHLWCLCSFTEAHSVFHQLLCSASWKCASLQECPSAPGGGTRSDLY